MSDKVLIESRDHWFRVIEMLQQNWALIDATEGGVTVYFVSDTGGVFYQIPFDSVDATKASLSENGFQRFIDDPVNLCPHPDEIVLELHDGGKDGRLFKVETF